MSNQSFTYDVAQNLTANAFQRKYIVTYNYNGATGGNSKTSDTATATFGGWNTKADGTGTSYADKASVKNLTTSGTFDLYAKWTLGTVTLPTPTKTGYTFGGWNTKSDGSGTKYNGGASFKPTTATTLYAQWTVNTYAVTVTAGTGTTISGVTAGTYDYGTVFTVSTAVKTGYDQSTPTLKVNGTVATPNADGTYTVTVNGATSITTDALPKNQYTVTFKNDDGTVLQTGKWDYNSTPTYSGATPAKTATAQYTYTFAGWTPTIAKVTKNATYTATYTSTVNQYTVTFKNDDGTVLQSGKWDYNSTPTYSGTTPTKAATAQYTYTFAGWSPTIAKVTKDATYTAAYTSTVNQYTVTFKNDDGTVLQTGKWDYNATPTYSGATPTKTATAQYSYTFAGWSPTVAKVTKNATYTAAYTSTVNQYTVTFKNDDGTVLQTGKWDYNATPTYSGATPTKTATAQYSYTFAGWSPTVAKVTKNATYTATYTSTVNTYTVTLDPDGGTCGIPAITAYYNEIYGTLPEPTRDGFAFDGWFLADGTLVTESTICTMTADHTLTAHWTAVETSGALTAKADSGAVVDRERGFVYGLAFGVTEAALREQYLDIADGTHIEIERVSAAIGTGTVLHLVDDTTGDELESFTVVIFGDVTGDGLLNSSDVTEIRSVNAGIITYEADSAQFFAADVTRDGNVNSSDVTEFRNANAGISDVSQTI